jgi:hypothetical protein
MGEGFVKLFSTILDSSIWGYDVETRIVWITLLAMADSKGRVHAAVPGIANRARVSMEATQKALDVFQEPDEHSRSSDYEGRRIVKDGRDWIILNFEEHRERQVKESEKARKRKWWRENRGKDAKLDNPSDGLADSSGDLKKTRPIKKAYKEGYKEGEEEKKKTIKKEIPARKTPDYPGDFLTFWAEYPRKKQKGAALKAWKNAKKKGMPALNDVLKAVEAQKQSGDWLKNNGEFIPYPASWLNSGSWDDEIDTTPRKTNHPDFTKMTASEQQYWRNRQILERDTDEESKPEYDSADTIDI